MDASRERIVAITITLLVHGLLVGWWWLAGAGGLGPGSARIGTLGDGDGLIVVEIVSVTTPSLSRATPETIPEPELSTDMSGEPVAAVVAPSHMDAKQLSESPTPEEQRTEPIADSAASGAAGGNGSQDDLAVRYRAALRAAIAHQWKQQTGRDLPGNCVIRLSQLAGGAVVSSRLGGCTLGQSERMQLEAAALMAQPLPYAGYEAAFVSDLALDL